MPQIALLRRFFAPTRVIPWTVATSLFWETMAVFVSAASIVAFREILPLIADASQREKIFLMLMALVVLSIVQFGISMFCSYRAGWGMLVKTFKKIITREYVERYVLLDNEAVHVYGTGKFIALLDGAINHWAELLWAWVSTNFSAILAFIVNLCIVAWINPLAIPPILIVLGLSWWASYHLNNKAIKYRKLRRDHDENALRRIVIVIMEKFAILRHGRIGYEQSLMDTEYTRSAEAGGWVDFYLVLNEEIQRFVINLGKICFILALVYGILHSDALMLDVATVFLVFGFLEQNILRLTEVYKNTTRDIVYLERILEVFDSIDTIQGYDTGTQYTYSGGTISLENISFSYRDTDTILRNFSLQIADGRRTALVGRSGSGKSTLVKLMMGFVRPQSGRICIDGQDIATTSLQSVYRHIGYLSQEPSVFDGTIRENITYGLENNPTEQDIRTALAHAQCEFVDRLPRGLETEIGEKGVRLSGGERQRLAIARLFLSGPEIIILDEPTSALDSFSEAKISEALHTLSEGKTLIVIAHRLQTVKEAHDIIVLDHGCIAERGTHDTLLAHGGVYAGMVDLQSGLIRE